MKTIVCAYVRLCRGIAVMIITAISVCAFSLSVDCHAAPTAGDSYPADAVDGLKFKTVVEISNRNPYVGEAIEVAWYLVCNTSEISGVDGMDLKLSYGEMQSDNDDFYRATVPYRENISYINEGKRRMLKIPVGRVVVVGKKKGNVDVRLGDGVVAVAVPQYVRDPFWGTIRRDRIVEYDVKGVRTSFKCRPLPGGAPVGFSGAVGSFEVKAVVGYPQMEVNEPEYLDVEVSGHGWMPEDAKADVKDAFSAPLRLKSIEEDRRSLYVDGSYYSTLNYTVDFVADRKGDYDVAPIKFVYFDPVLKKYRTAESSPVTVSVGNRKDSSSHGKSMPV